MDTSSIHRSNNFDFIRIAAASMVVFSHSFDLLIAPIDTNGEPLRWLTGNQMNLGKLGVWIFFSLSGYLITQSLVRSKSYSDYFVKRSLRIFPALILDILIAVFIWGALVTTLSSTEYFSSPYTYRYLLNVFLFKLYFTLPGVFTANPYPDTVNGSLWTLPYEFLSYIGIVLLHFSRILRNKYVYAAFYLVAFIVGFVISRSAYAGSDFPGVNLEVAKTYTLCSIFGMGSLLFFFCQKFNGKIALILLIVWCVSFYFQLSAAFAPLCVPYVVLWFALECKTIFQNVGKYGDFSYGIYIYSFPVQQTLVYYFSKNLKVWQMIILSFMGTLPLAALSWFTVEKPALKLKNHFSRRLL